MMHAPGPSILRAFARDRRGAASAEFALVSMAFIAAMLSIIDASRLAWELNSAKAATRAGARFAAVSPMVSTKLATYSGVDSGIGNGEPIPPNAALNVSCTSSSCSSGGADAAAFAAIVARMQGYYGRVQPANVVVEYEHVGLGVSGTPNAPDVQPLVTVRLTGLTFAPGMLQVFGIAPFNLPPVASTFSGEDLT
jgi:Flp pilus assembly pilin Flp